MSDVVIDTSPWTKPLVLTPGARVIGGPNFGQGDGQRAVVMLDGPIDTLGLGPVEFTPNICLKATPRNPLGLLQIRSDGVKVNCELDASGLGIQLVQSLCYEGKPATPPRDSVFDRIYCHDNSDPGADKNGYNHALYLQDSTNAGGVDMRFERIGGGSAIQFGGHACTGAKFDRASLIGCFMGFFFWGSGTHDNHVGHCYIPPTTPHRTTYPIDWVSAGVNNTVDYVTVPTPGYGATTATTPSPVDVAGLLDTAAAAIDKARAALKT